MRCCQSSPGCLTPQHPPGQSDLPPRGSRQDFSELELTCTQPASSPGTHRGALGQADTTVLRACPAQSLFLVGVKICFALLLRGRLWARALPELLLVSMEDQPGQRTRGKPKCHGVFCHFFTAGNMSVEQLY